MHLAKGVVLIAGYVILKTGLGMLSWIMFGLVAYSMLVIGFRPWRHAIVNGMESLTQTSLILCVALALIWAERDNQMDHDLAVLGVGVSMSPFLAISVLFAYLVYPHVRARLWGAKDNTYIKGTYLRKTTRIWQRPV